MKRAMICLFAVSIFSGCAGLQIQKDDSIPLKITKGLARVPYCILTCGLSERYYSIDRAVKSWVGHTVDNLMMSWGPPSQVYDDGGGGKYVIYTENRSYVSPGYATTTGSSNAYGYVSGNDIYVHGYGESQTTYTPPQVHQWSVFRMFRVNEYGRIVAYSWQGL